jgi:hypothetical protein
MLNVMYLGGIDERAGVVITIYCAGAHSDAEYERSIADVHRVDALTAAGGGALVHIVIEDEGSESPSPKWRRRFAAISGELRAQPYYFAFVTNSALIRGGFTAVRWLRGERKGHHLAAFASFEQACAWIREMTGAAYPRLEALHAEARARTR